MALATTSDRVKHADNKLNNAYSKGNIVYPRTEFDYDTHKEFDFFAHPKIEKFDDFSVPLTYKKYPFMKDALPIELSNFRLATAATLMPTISWIDKFYDDNLKPLSSSHEKQIDSKLDKFYDHLEYLDRTYNTDTIRTKDKGFDIDKISKDGYIARMKMEIMPFRIPLQPTPELMANVKKVKLGVRKKKRSQDIKSFSGLEEKVIKVSSMDIAIALFQKRNLGIFYIRKKAEQMMRENFVLNQEQFQKELQKSKASSQSGRQK